MLVKEGFLVKNSGKFWYTTNGEQVKAKCEKCGEPVEISVEEIPIYICKNNHYHGRVFLPAHEHLVRTIKRKAAFNNDYNQQNP